MSTTRPGERPACECPNDCPRCTYEELELCAASTEERQLADWAEAQGERFDPAFGDYNLNPGGL